MQPTAIAAKEFEADCQKLIDEVAQDGKPLVITKGGKPVARLVPYDDLPPMRGDWVGKAKVLGDIVHFDTSDDWDDPGAVGERSRASVRDTEKIRGARTDTEEKRIGPRVSL